MESTMRKRCSHSGRPANHVAVFSSPRSLETFLSSEDSFLEVSS